MTKFCYPGVLSTAPGTYNPPFLAQYMRKEQNSLFLHSPVLQNSYLILCLRLLVLLINFIYQVSDFTDPLHISSTAYTVPLYLNRATLRLFTPVDPHIWIFFCYESFLSKWASPDNFLADLTKRKEIPLIVTRLK